MCADGRQRDIVCSHIFLQGILTDQSKSTETTKVGEEMICEQLLMQERGEYHIDTSVNCLLFEMTTLNVNVMSKMMRIPI